MLRFDGGKAWLELDAVAQHLVCVAALELVAAWHALEALDPADHARYRTAETAACQLDDVLADLVRAALPAHFAAGVPLIPSLIGPVCRGCGCSEHDACGPEPCAWAEPDLCTACHKEIV